MIGLRRIRRIAMVAALTACCCAPSVSVGGDSPAVPMPRSVMHRIFEALVDVLPRVLDDERFARPEELAEVKRGLAELVAASRDLDAHARERDADFRSLGRSLSQEFQEAMWRLERERPESARFFVVAATQYCVACHARLPKARDFPMADRLIERVDTKTLAPPDRALLYVVARSFDRAMSEWEAALIDPAVTPGELDILEALDAYLTVAVRVQRDLPRARATLERVGQRSDLRDSLRRLLAHWARSLDALREDVRAEPSVERARGLIDVGLEAGRNVWRREQRVHELVASSLLLRLIDAASEPDSEVAEAFYWLGTIEARTAGSPWSPQAERHLETAIRMNPGAPFAGDALALLEEYLAFGYGGSGGLHLPPEVARTLRELRELVDRSAPEPSPL